MGARGGYSSDAGNGNSMPGKQQSLDFALFCDCRLSVCLPAYIVN